MNKFSYTLLYGCARLFSMLPFWGLYLISDIVYVLAYKIFGYRRKVVAKNLKSAFPDKSEWELHKIETEFYHNLCDYFVETIKVLDMSEEQMKSRMHIENADMVEKAMLSGCNVVFYLSHCFNWEWMTSLKLAFSDDLLITQIYHPLENKYFDKLFYHIRSKFGQENIAMEETLRVLLRYKQENRRFALGCIADQGPSWGKIGAYLKFMNQDTAVFTGSEKIARKFNAVVVFGDVIKVRRGYYRCVITKLCDDVQTLDDGELTKLYFKQLEQSLNNNPANWLWTHRRWKRTIEGYYRYLSDHNLQLKIKLN